MAINERLVHTASAAAAGTGNQEEGLVLHLDANDVDSYDGDGDIWYDIHDHEYTPSTNVSEHFNTVLYTGDDANNRGITGAGFQPDLVWIKNRDGNYSHMIYDSIRGATGSGGDHLSSDTTGAAGGSVTGLFNSFDSDGFSINKGTSSRVNQSGDDYVAWCFKAGGAAVSNTGGDITSQVSANNDLGFSIVQYTGNLSGATTATGQGVGHGMDVPPELIIFKRTDSTSDWNVFSNQLDNWSTRLELNDRVAKNNLYSSYPMADPTGSVFYTNYLSAVNISGATHIAYCFASKRGVSKVGSYIGNGTTNNKIYTGFEPAFFMLKNTSRDNTGWLIKDNVRGENSKTLLANSSAVEYNTTAYWTCDFERDGVRLTYGADNEFNRNGDTYIYYAVAKNTKETSLIDDTDLELHLDPASYSGSGTTWTADAGNDATVVASRYDQELGDSFDISTDGESTIQIASGHGLNGTNFTLEFWFKWQSTPSAANRFIYEANTGWNFFYYGGSGWRINNADVATGYFANGSYITTKKWYHCVITQDSSNCKIYFDGELVKTQSVTSGTRSLGAFDFGSTDISADKPKCDIGQIRTYSAALTQDEVRQNFNFTKNRYPNGHNATNSGATFSPSTTPNYWSFDGNNDAMLLSTTSALLGDTNNIKTISGFITLSSTTARGFIYSVSSSSNSDDYFYIGWLGDQNKVYIASRDGSSSNSFTHTAPLTGVANTWKHICVAGGDGNTPKIYVNGVELTVTSSLSGSATSASWIDYPSYSGTIYTYVAKLRQYLPGSNHWHNGRIGQVKLYDETLTSTEVLALFNAEKDIYGL